jgi:glutaminyl-peptide cyclotransferase
MRRRTEFLAFVLLVGFEVHLGSAGQTREVSPRTYGYQIVKSYPHDPSAFTQGLLYRDGYLYESTGISGRSTLRKVDLESGRVLQQYTVLPDYFAEGLTDWGPNLIQLTYQTQTGFVYERATLTLKSSFVYAGEGWGLTHDTMRLIMSDGSSSLRFLDPATYKETGRLTVRDRGRPVADLNELEYVRGEIYANVWHTDRIARVSPATGDVLGWIDLANLLRPGEIPKSTVSVSEAVLNGIAYDAARDRLFVTGKLWPKLFEIKVVPR